VRRSVLLVITVLLISQANALTCAADNAAKPGTCISNTYKFFNRDVYQSCYSSPYYDTGGLWPGYVQCYATIRTGSVTSDKGSPVVEAWTTDLNKLNLCASYNTYACDVNPGDGFTLTDTSSDRGYCDASDANCIKCDANKVEIKSWTGSAWIIGDGDNQCESGCGASNICDEVSANTWSSKQISGTQMEAFCNSSCTKSNERCNTIFGAETECNYLVPTSVCATDSCTTSKTLIDYNNNQALDSVTCDSSCACDTDYNTPVCDTECGASSECNNQLIGYNLVDRGCDSSCSWQVCGLYQWLGTNCLNTCTGNFNCFNSVCDLVGEGSYTCVIDSEAPSVSMSNPVSYYHYNSLPVMEFTISDSVDANLYCAYILDSNNFALNIYDEQGYHTHEFSYLAQGWHDLGVNCTDDANNNGYSNTARFLYDINSPTYNSNGVTNLTVIEHGYITFLDTLRLHAYFSDNFYLNTSVLWTNRSGTWQVEAEIQHSGASNAWANYTIDLTSDGDKTIKWQIITNDSAGNTISTPIQEFYVYAATKDISLTLNEAPVNDYLEFTANAQPTIGSAPVDTLRTALIGDFKVNHDGIGLPVDAFFYLNHSLSSDFTLKVSTSNNYNTTVTLTTSQQVICSEIIPGESCEVWAWLDWTGEALPGFIDNIIEVESEFS